MGKGDGRRPTLVNDATFTDNWCAAFGHRPRTSDASRCRECGGVIIEATDGVQRLVPARAGRTKRRTKKDAEE